MYKRLPTQPNLAGLTSLGQKVTFPAPCHYIECRPRVPQQGRGARIGVVPGCEAAPHPAWPSWRRAQVATLTPKAKDPAGSGRPRRPGSTREGQPGRPACQESLIWPLRPVCTRHAGWYRVVPHGAVCRVPHGVILVIIGSYWPLLTGLLGHIGHY